MINPWHPMTDPIDLKTLGKFTEELGECVAAVSRCMIQGIDEYHPQSGIANRDWLEEEIADVMAGIELTVERFGLNEERIFARAARKIAGLREWHALA